MPSRNPLARRELTLVWLLSVVVALPAGCAEPIFRHEDAGSESQGDPGHDGGKVASGDGGAMAEDAGGDGDGDGDTPMQDDGGMKAEADAGDAGGPGGNLYVDGPSVIAAGYCKPINIVRTVVTAQPESLKLATAGLELFSDANCTEKLAAGALSFAGGADSLKNAVWLRATLTSGSVQTTGGLTLRTDTGTGSYTVDVRRPAVAVESGMVTTCFLLDDGHVECVGDNALNTAGQEYGDPTATYKTGRFIAAPLKAMFSHGLPFSKISMAGYTGCGISADDAYCWGDGAWGKLGDPTTSASSPYAKNIQGMVGDITDIDVGEAHVCAIASGDVYCWGDNLDHESSQSNDENVKASKVSGLNSPALEVAAGALFSCALLSDLTVWCWGDSSEGKLGIPANADVNKLVQVPFEKTPKTLSHLSAEHGTTCVLADGDVVCWGGEQGAPPEIVLTGLSDLSLIEVGEGGACTSNGVDVSCWGINSLGELGTGSQHPAAPAKVPGLPAGKVEALSMDGGPSSQCAIVDGLPYCWGLQDEAQLGIDGQLGDFLTPIASPLLAGRELARVTGDGQASCMLDHQDVLSCWGDGHDGELGVDIFPPLYSAVPGSVKDDQLGKSVQDVEFGERYVLARAQGKLFGWGLDFFALPDRIWGFVPKEVPIDAPGGSVTRISATKALACAVVEGGSAPGVYCFGLNGDSKHLIVGTETQDPLIRTPTRLNLPAGTIKSLDTNRDTSCVVLDDGSEPLDGGDVYCWGRRRTHQGPEKIDIGGFHDFAHVATYALGNVCAVRSNGDLWCFKDDAATATQVSSDFTALRSSITHICGLKRDANGAFLYCWGDNAFGQLGTGDRAPRTTPVRVKGLVGDVSQFDLGGSILSNTCAKDSEGWKCWGSNTSRQFIAVPFVHATPALIAPWQ